LFLLPQLKAAGLFFLSFFQALFHILVINTIVKRNKQTNKDRGRMNSVENTCETKGSFILLFG
jgi:hypothetical protein